ncbi:DUF2723 domain-containing protein [Candidatus Symbiothrix dinenymphae]|uniref:glycosyltransferase family 117 protein n=1 Tax=Candidatus Symbiothrix dinenymphae TaxID=467085 RepID=UPI0006C4C662|nr:DUF2723 domain-containing protein [Candidatus Symbiothrix dinenymphae]GAP72205.1 hypothetical protein SAMD00024442_27_15 [Candidatus Symbiothrix dinenymphae]
MKKYNLVNNICGWVVFAIASVVYLLTIEPSMSFWDCGEFISSAYKLEVGHPAGAPMFMLFGNFFSHFASNPADVALWLNALSAMFSALTILFLFWTITHLVKRLVLGWGAQAKPAMTTAQLITILGSGAVGALAYTFSDTFWFSAVEGEVYACSSFLTAIVFWLILKWEDVADEPQSGRWLILIAYLTGVSVGIHLLNLLCIPAIVLVYYFRKTKTPTWKGIVAALLIAFGTVAAVLYGLVQGLVEVAGVFELFFVNTLHLPYNTGVAVYMVLLFGILTYGIWLSMKATDNAAQLRNAKIVFVVSIALLGIPFLGSGIWLGILLLIILCCYLFISKKISPVALNSILIGLLVMTIGYSAYALTLIRATANTPMNQNAPDNIFTLREYLSREQYGATPLFYGQTFVAEVQRNTKTGEVIYEDSGPIWSRVPKKDASEPDRYYESGRKSSPVYVDKLCTLFPRMYSSTGNHVQGYKQWSNFKGEKVRVPEMQEDGKMGSRVVMKPTFGENLRYFFSYQVNFMYWRYFMWNFAGRQNDIQGHGEVANGNWITGIPFLDASRVGPQKGQPDFIAKNKGHNTYYMLPLLLGLLGILVQLKSGKSGTQQFWVCFSLFFMTGLAIVLYLNQPPYQPRERDYAYAGSFYVYAIWIGIGVLGIIKGLEKLKLPATISAALATVLSLLVPIQMASQTWDDHDRSKRFVGRDLGRNYLATCEPNAIIFTCGDNDTFPLWYAQEVEGYRTDVRVCNLSYLQTDWYISQMKCQAYESTPLPIDWERWEYVQGTHEAAYIVPMDPEPWTAERAFNRVKSDDPRTKRLPRYNVSVDNIPTHRVIFPVDAKAAIASGTVNAADSARIVPYMLLNLGETKNEAGQVVEGAKNILNKSEMMMLDILKNNADWKRPVYMSTTVGGENWARMQRYFRQDGMAYRFVPMETYQGMDANLVYDNFMNKFEWGNMDKEQLYLDETCRRLATTYRTYFGRLARTLAEQGDVERTEAVVDRCLEVIPDRNLPLEYYSAADLAEALARVGKTEKAVKLYTILADVLERELNWYTRLNTNHYGTILNDVRRDLAAMQYILYYFSENAKEQMSHYEATYEAAVNRYQSIVGNNR